MTFDDREARIREYLDEEEWWVEDPYIYILGLDPGGTTGVAMLRIDTRDDEINPELVFLHQVEGGLQGFIDWFKHSHRGEHVVIVSEKWRERNVKGADRTPQYIEGAMHVIWGGDMVVWQYPNYKDRVPDEWLKENNLWTPDHRHQMDALKHAFAYLLDEEHAATIASIGGRSDEPMLEEGEAEDAQLGEGEAENAEDMIRIALELGQAKLEDLDPEAEPQGAPSEEGGGQGIDEEWDSQELGFKGDRSKREVGGAFAGYNPEGYDEGTTLFED